MIDDCIEGNISKIIIAHKDRFIRFGYDWFERFLKKNGVEIVIVNNEKLSPQEELVEGICVENEWNIVTMECGRDHVHSLYQLQATYLAKR